MYICPNHCFLEALIFSGVRRNLHTARLPNFVIFVFCDQDDYGVSRHFIIAISDCLVLVGTQIKNSQCGIPL